LDVIRQQDGPQTLFYLDPPYLHETRSTTKEYGEHEMNEEAHAELLNAINNCKGNVMISGYRSELYDDWLGGWTRHDFDLPNNAAAGKTKERETEVLWCNF
jgi:DNA adenine methylase